MNEVLKAIQERRSTRGFSGEPLEEAQLQALITAKQQVVLLYQQQADPAVCQQALLNVQNLAAAVQQSTAQLALYES